LDLYAFEIEMSYPLRSAAFGYEMRDGAALAASDINVYLTIVLSSRKNRKKIKFIRKR